MVNQRVIFIFLCIFSLIVVWGWGEEPGIGFPQIFTSTSSLFTTYTQYSVGSLSEAVAIGDVNNDGKNEVLLSTSSYADPSSDFHLFVFSIHSTGSGDLLASYDLKTSTSWGTALESIGIGDFNHDGKKDVAVSRTGHSIYLLYQNNFGSLDSATPIISKNTRCLTVGDFNHDGYDDIATMGWGTHTVDVYLQDTVSGGFGTSTKYYAPHGGYDVLKSGDMNHDGLMDLVVMSGQGYSNPNFTVLLQTVGGTFVLSSSYTIAPSTLVNGIGVGDVNHDGWDDVVMSVSFSNAISVYLQNSGGTLDKSTSYPTSGSAIPVEIGDLDGDGREDVATGINSDGYLNLFNQDSTGKLKPYDNYGLIAFSYYSKYGLAIGNIDGDGRNDIALADNYNGLIVLLNQGNFIPVPVHLSCFEISDIYN